MKPKTRSNRRNFPKSLAICLAPLLGCATAQATIVIANDSNGSGTWTFPAGTNLLTSPSPSTVASHEGSDTNWSRVIDGSLGDTGGSAATSCTPNNGNVVTFPLDLTGHPAGRDITSFDSYCTWGNSGRDNQNYTLQYSTVADPTTFINITAVNNGTGSDRSTHSRVTNDAGFLATGVHSVRIIFGAANGGQENGYVGYREFIVTDTPNVISLATEATTNNAFFLPAGPNLLTGVTPVETPATHEGSSGTWTTTIDGSVGDYTTPTTSVTPNNGNTVTFPLDLSGAHSGGYNITSFDSYAAWGSNGRDDQHYTLSYSTVADPTTFIPITDVAVHTEFNVAPRQATHARVTANGGVMASNVAAIRLTFNGQENGFEGYREFVLQDTSHNNIATESNNTNSWTLPVGTNLLSSATAYTPNNPANSNHGNGDVTGGTWNILTDGTIGSAGNQSQTVAPLEDASVIYTLDTSTNVNGYNISAFDAYAAWGDSGRDDQSFSVLYSTVADPGTFIPIGRIENHTNSGYNATHSRITPPSGFLATNVGAVKFFFKNQENGYVGYREFIASGSAVSLASPLTWSGLSSNGSWVSTSDNNWTNGVSSANFTSLAPLTFDDSGTFTTIDIPTALTAASLTFSGNTAPYVFNGELLTVTNDVSLTGSASAIFNNSVQATGLSVSGTGTLTLSVDNPLTGSSVVNNGVLNLSSDGALGTSALSQTGGTINFKSSSPTVNSLGGTGGNLYLGNSATSGASVLFVGDTTSTTYAGNLNDASPTAIGSLTKNGSGSLTLTGTNNYTGITTVTDGELKLGKRLSLYNGSTGSWTASNLIVYGTLGLRMGGTGEFTSADLAALDTGGFDTTAVLSLDTTSGNTSVTDSFGGAMKIEKVGLNTLSLAGTNTFSNGITVGQGAIEAANPSGISIPSDLTVGNVTFDAWANMAYSNQFGSTSLVKFNTGPGAVNGKLNLRGTSQTIAGLESGNNNRIAIVQNDETSAPGYTSNPGACSLTINTAPSTFHSFRGIIRNQDGGALSIIKTGTGTQELINPPISSISYNGTTSVNEGTLRINFNSGFNTSFGSNITVASGATLNFHAVAGNYAFDRVISGDGNIVVDGTNAVIFFNNQHTFTNGVTVGVNTFDGFLALSGNGGAGAGNATGQFCTGGAMIPTNVITVNGGATLSLDGVAPLGNSTMVPAFAPSIHINENSTLYGGTNTVAFVPNITLDGGKIQITDGANHGGFGTDLTFVGTVVVGGSSTVPSTIFTTGTGANANASLGSAALPGTTFDVANVTGDSAADLTISTNLRNLANLTSPLVKTGPGTMLLSGTNTYTGDTTVSGGELTLSGSSIANTNKLVIDGGKVGVVAAANETVKTLFFGAIQQDAGTYGSTASGATHQDDTRFSGTGIITVTNGPIVTYEDWSLAITNPSDRDRTDDADGDGQLNIDEFLFGTSPISGEGSLTTTETTGSGLIIHWSERIGSGSTYLLQESTDLTTWNTSAVVPTVDANQSALYSDSYVRKQAIIPITGGSKFARVQATE